MRKTNNSVTKNKGNATVIQHWSIYAFNVGHKVIMYLKKYIRCTYWICIQKYVRGWNRWVTSLRSLFNYIKQTDSHTERRRLVPCPSHATPLRLRPRGAALPAYMTSKLNQQVVCVDFRCLLSAPFDYTRYSMGGVSRLQPIYSIFWKWDKSLSKIVLDYRKVLYKIN